MSFSQSFRPRLVIPTGDPAGIGAEVVLKALADVQLTAGMDITVVGTSAVLNNTYQLLHAQASTEAIAHPHTLNLLEVELSSSEQAEIQIGTGNAVSGEASFRYLETAIAHTLAGNFDGIVTAPIAKSAWNAAGHSFPGQTELLAEKAQVTRFGMMFVARSPHTNWILRTLLATTHIPLRAVPDALTADLLTQKLDLLVHTLQHDFGLDTPSIAVAGLNPHSGEQGHLGREEMEWMLDWFQEMGDRYPSINLNGPVPPDTLWVRPGQAWFGTQGLVTAHDAYLALYHDQGLIPVKLMGFDRAVNTTIGLPFVRTSPDHGTAFDIAGKGIADATSMKEAIYWAAEVVRYRRASV